MAFSVVMPALEMAQETGKILAWRKKEGERVAKGEPLLEIETDKAVVEVEAPANGILTGIKAGEGVEIPVGQTIAWIVAPGEAPPVESESREPAARAVSHAKREESHATPAAVATLPAGSGARVSPKARRLAKELGVDIASVKGSGAGREILASDVEAAASHPASAPMSANVPASLEVPTSIGRIMAERTTESWTTVPHFFVSRDVEVEGLTHYRETTGAEIERTHHIRVTHTDLLVAITSRVLLKHPRLNASWSANGIRLHEHVNMGLAVAVEDGVVAVVIQNAHTASLAEIAKQRIEFSGRARAGKLRPADIAGATFTISNLGMYQVDRFSAIIVPPQAAILAVGSISDRIVAVDGSPAVRSMMTLTISCDHRVVDGARAAKFLNGLVQAARDPAAVLG
jgi:pyruvate dehydrogenase E2 component (dihydrolipoamide acetyltransferase)